MKKKNNIFTVMKKELARFFGDRRMMASIFLPGILIYLLYSLMGESLMSGFGTDEDTRYYLQAQNLPSSIQVILEHEDSPFILVDQADPMASVEDQNLDLYVVFPTNFEEEIVKNPPESYPRVEVFYNSASSHSSSAYAMLITMLDNYESLLANRFDVNIDPEKSYDLATAEDTTGMIFSMMMPMLLLMLTPSIPDMKITILRVIATQQASPAAPPSVDTQKHPWLRLPSLMLRKARCSGRLAKE